MAALGLEMYARILANLASRRGAKVDEILAELGVDPGDLRESEEALRKELSLAWPTRKGIGAMKFATALGRELSRLDTLGGGAAPDRAKETLGPAPAAGSVATALPSYLQAEAMPAPVKAPLPPIPPVEPLKRSLAATGIVDAQSIIRGLNLPFAKAAEPPAAEPAEDPLLPLPVYAEIVVHLGRGDDKAALFAKHKLTEATWSTNATAWSQRLQREPELLQQFRAQVQELKSRL